MTKQEKDLLKRLAEAYAFIEDLRTTAVLLGNVAYIRRTEGVDIQIAKFREEYSPLFQRYFNNAKRSATAEQMKKLENNGKREDIQRRKEEKAKAEEAQESISRIKKKAKVPRRRRRDVSKEIKKEKPE